MLEVHLSCLHMKMESSSKDEERMDRESRLSRDEDGEEDDGNCSTNENTMSVTGSSSTEKRPRSVVWKFFSFLENGKKFSVSCVELEIKMACLHIMEVQRQCMNI